MNHKSLMAVTRVISASLLVVSNGFGETFTNSKGVSIEGEIVSADIENDQVTLYVKRYLREYRLKISDLAQDSRELVQAWWDERHPRPAEWVKPGAKHLLEFPDLPNNNHDEKTASCEVFIPENYTSDKPVPLVVWLAGGKGGNRVGAATAVAGTENFVCASFPYPPYGNIGDARERRGQNIEEFWLHHKAMLDGLAKAIPNLDPRIRALGGFSNGTHTMAEYFNQVEKDFAPQFSVYIFGDGGSTANSNRWTRRLNRDKFAYFTWGEKSENRSMTILTADFADSAGMKIYKSEMKDTGHKLIPEEKERIKKWLNEVVLPEMSASEQ